MIDYIECSIALIKNNTDYLFSRRIKKPFHNHYEFPGGKIENRETPEEALARECYEELDIEIIENIYHGSITHRYDKLSVRLHIFEIIKYIGKIKPNEKQELKYINHATSNLLFLESTSRVLNRLKLRELFFITPRNINKILKQFASLDQCNSFVRLRSHDYSRTEYILAAKTLSTICLQKNIPFIIDKKFMNDLNHIKYDGIHFTSNELDELTRNEMIIRKNGYTYSASCHSLENIITANKNNFDFIVISPVIYSKYLTDELGWEKFSSLVSESNMPTYALGGLKPNDLSLCKSFGGFGVSGISRFWY